MAQQLRCIFSHFYVNSRKALTHTHIHMYILAYARLPARVCVCVLHSSCDLIPIPFVAVAVCFHFRPSLSLAKESERNREGKGRVGQAGLAASRSHAKLLHTTMFTMCDKRCRKRKSINYLQTSCSSYPILLPLPPLPLSLFRCLSFVMVAILAHYVIHQGTAGAVVVAVAVDVAANVDVPLLNICL